MRIIVAKLDQADTVKVLSFSSHVALLSAVIPAILGLKLPLEHSNNDAGVKLLTKN